MSRVSRGQLLFRILFACVFVCCVYGIGAVLGGGKPPLNPVHFGFAMAGILSPRTPVSRLHLFRATNSQKLKA